MKIAFFHVGIDLSLAEMFCKSAKIALAGSCYIIQITDNNTPKAKSADSVFRLADIDPKYPMLTRMKAYRTLISELKELVLFFDTDMLIVKDFTLNLKDGQVALCRRSFGRAAPLNDKFQSVFGDLDFFPEHRNRSMDDEYPYVGCFFADSSTAFLDKALEIYLALDQRYWKWYGDQRALKEAATYFDILEVSESQIACLPERVGEKDDGHTAAIHFKGRSRKILMHEYFRQHCLPKSSEVIRSFRSNPNKAGYEIPKTLNPYFSNYLVGASSAQMELVEGYKIDLASRADVLCKIMFLLSQRYSLVPKKIGSDVYAKHLNALNTCSGSDAPDKNSLSEYTGAFLDLHDRIIDEGCFDEVKGIVPVSAKNVLIDGAHRLSISLVTELKLPILKLPVNTCPTQPLSVLQERYGLNGEEYLLALRTYLTYDPDAKIIILYPNRNRSQDAQVLDLIKKYLKIEAQVSHQISSYREAKTLVSCLYSGNSWLQSNFSGVTGLTWKTRQVYTGLSNVDFLIVSPYTKNQTVDTRVLKDLKELSRFYYGNGFHSVHSTDNIEENLRVFSNIIMDNTSARYLHDNFEVSTALLNAKQRDFFDSLSRLSISCRERIVITGSLVLACLNIRPAKDIDIITDLEIFPEIARHNQFIEAYSGIGSFTNVLSHPANTFWMIYKGKSIRLLSLDILLEMKMSRAIAKSQPKDELDISLIREFIQQMPASSETRL